METTRRGKEAETRWGEVRQVNIVPSVILIPFFYMLPVHVLFQVPVGDYCTGNTNLPGNSKNMAFVFFKKKKKHRNRVGDKLSRMLFSFIYCTLHF